MRGTVSLAASVLIACTAHAQDSKLIGKPCPALKLAPHMLQGDPITPDDFADKVVFIDVYQRGCPTCESNSMPHLQALYSRWKNDSRVLILAINTAFEKDQYPWMADEDGTREHLRNKGWEMPVARDLGEETVRLLGMGESYGTPMALVLDPSGTVIGHSWNSRPEDAARLERIFEDAVDALTPRISVPDRSFHERLAPAVELLAKHDAAGALKLCSRYTADSFDAAIRADAQALHDHIEASIEAEITLSRDLFAQDPLAAVERAALVETAFRGTPPLKDLAREVGEWKQRAEYQDLLKMTRELDKIDARLGKGPLAARPRDQAIGLLERVVEAFPDSRTARRARKALRTLQPPQ